MQIGGETLFLLSCAPADQLGLEVRGILWILRLPSGRTDPADLWDQAHHLHPEKGSQSREANVGTAHGLTTTAGEVLNESCNTYSRTRCSDRSLRAGGTWWTLWRRRKTSTNAPFVDFCSRWDTHVWRCFNLLFSQGLTCSPLSPLLPFWPGSPISPCKKQAITA